MKKIIKTDVEESWWDNNRGFIIFYSGLISVILFGITPWLIGWFKILQWIF